ncbi:ATP-binding protein [Lactococcus lactis]|uniref:ATP-binding protein n=1 Tax=Lactococcus lactis TaxID=1358 RepID=UPI00223C1A79|nr:ATP-binding protein [Lactococcus lactis]MCT1183585.1 ATP-binding protein [Lactococcus lactis]
MELFNNKYPIYMHKGPFLNDGLIYKQFGFHFAKDNWNDYGHKTSYNLKFVSKEFKIELDTSIRVTKLTDAEFEVDTINMEDLMSRIVNIDVVSLGNPDYYEFLNKFFNQSEKELWFKILGDLAYDKNRFEKLYSKSLDINQTVIQNSLLRDISKSEVSNQLHRMTRGDKFQEKYSIKLKFSDDVSLNIETDPDTNYPDNLYAIVGNNGSGKTFLIREVAKNFLLAKGEVEKDSNLLVNGDISEFENLLFISYSPFDERITKNDNEVFKEIGLVNSGNKDLREVMNEEIFKAINRLGKEKRAKLHIVLEKFTFDPWFQQISFEIQNEELKLGSNQIKLLSSGQKIILLSLVNLVLHVSEKTLVIIDEPELFLHPPLLKAYIRAVGDLVAFGNGVGLFTTHSPVVLQEIPHNCIIRTGYNAKEQKYFYKNMTTRTFGESINFINDAVFGLDLRNTGYYNLLQKLFYEDAIDHRIENILGSEGRLLLRTLDQERRNEED